MIGVPVDGPIAHARWGRLASTALLWSNVAATSAATYLATLTVVALRAHRRQQPSPRRAAPRTRFAVLVPAHNEAAGIAGTLRSLQALEYPAGAYSIHVVADNCSDETASVARQLGAAVHERTAPDDPGKGPALEWLLRRLAGQGTRYDAVAIFDADTVVAPDFLSIMDDHLVRGEKAVQGYYAVRDDHTSWVVSLRAAALAMRHYLQPLARTALGGSAGLRGNGMVFAAQVLEHRHWTAHLTEDLQFEAELLLGGQRVHFAPDAVIHAEMPVRLSEARTQNARWERGRFETARTYAPTLLRQAATRPAQQRFACADAAVESLLPPLSVLAAGAFVNAAASAGLWARGVPVTRRLNVVLATGTATVLAAYVVSALRMVRAPADVWRSLARAPLYVVWKVCIWGVSLIRAPGRWIRTPRRAV